MTRRAPVEAPGAPGPVEADARDVAWFERTGHCGGCGQPGAYCQCTSRRPCGCRHLHVMGAGIGVDPAALFADCVADNQGELFA